MRYYFVGNIKHLLQKIIMLLPLLLIIAPIFVLSLSSKLEIMENPSFNLIECRSLHNLHCYRNPLIKKLLTCRGGCNLHGRSRKIRKFAVGRCLLNNRYLQLSRSRQLRWPINNARYLIQRSLYNVNFSTGSDIN